MTHLFFTDPKTVQRMHDGPLRAYIDAYAARLQSQGYTGQCARNQIRLVADLSRWLRKQGLAAKNLNPQRTQRYLSYRKRRLRPHHGDASALVKLLGLLREAGVVNDQTPPAAVSPGQRVEENFKRYLSQERGLSSATQVNYLPFVRQFLVERFGAGRIHLAHLHAADITGFVQRHAHDLSPGRAKLMVTALRAFLRHLRYRGDIATDLAACVPCVPNWSFSTLPKFLLPGQVQRILEHCDQRTPSGKRDYAILLLLARLGLRTGEVVALTLDDIEWEQGRITLRSKGGRWAQLALPAEVGKALAHYLKQGRPRCASRRVFIRQRAPRVGFANSIAICSLVERALVRAEIDSPRKGGSSIPSYPGHGNASSRRLFVGDRPTATPSTSEHHHPLCQGRPSGIAHAGPCLARRWAMKRLRKAVHNYLAMRRALGFKLRDAGVGLWDFVAFLQRQRASCITIELALQWGGCKKNCVNGHRVKDNLNKEKRWQLTQN